jgi:hypothetical protein
MESDRDGFILNKIAGKFKRSKKRDLPSVRVVIPAVMVVVIEMLQVLAIVKAVVADRNSMTTIPHASG